MDPIRAIDEIKQHGFHEVYHKTVFKCYRLKNDEPQVVEIEILDAGPEINKRYHCKATSEEGKRATGNPGSTIMDVLENLHWQDLD